MTTVLRPSVFLRRVLWADALVSAAVGLVMALAATPLGAWTGLPAALLAAAGLALLPYAAYLAWLARRDAVPAMAVGLPIALNLVWALDCAWLAFGGGVAPTGLGLAFLAVQAVTVIVFAELEFTGMRRAAQRIA